MIIIRRRINNNNNNNIISSLLLFVVSFTFFVVCGGGRGGDVVPLGQSVRVPNAEFLSCWDLSQSAVENLQMYDKGGGERKKLELSQVSKIK